MFGDALDRHLAEVDARRHIVLDMIAAEPPISVRAMAGALVRPLAAKLADAGGAAFLPVYASLLRRPRPVLPIVADARYGSLQRWHDMLDPLLDPDAARMHPRQAALIYAATELSRRAQAGRHTDDRLFTSHLVDVIAAILTTPMSAETRQLRAATNRVQISAIG